LVEKCFSNKLESFECVPVTVISEMWLQVSRLALWFAWPPMQWVPGGLFPGVKWPGCESEHSPPSSAEVKNGGTTPTIPHIPSWHGT
jgi:hypothetical protein